MSEPHSASPASCGALRPSLSSHTAVLTYLKSCHPGRQMSVALVFLPRLMSLIPSVLCAFYQPTVFLKDLGNRLHATTRTPRLRNAAVLTISTTATHRVRNRLVPWNVLLLCYEPKPFPASSPCGIPRKPCPRNFSDAVCYCFLANHWIRRCQLKHVFILDSWIFLVLTVSSAA